MPAVSQWTFWFSIRNHLDQLEPLLLRFGGSYHSTLLQVGDELEKLSFTLERYWLYISFPASAIIPEEDIVVRTPNGIEARRSNNFLKHFSFSFNRRYNFIFKWTWDGYKFFSTTALCLYLFQGPPDQVFLGFFVSGLEAFPQFLGEF